MKNTFNIIGDDTAGARKLEKEMQSYAYGYITKMFAGEIMEFGKSRFAIERVTHVYKLNDNEIHYDIIEIHDRH